MKSPAPRWRGTLCSLGQHPGLKAGSRFQRHMTVLEEERCDEEVTGQGVVGAVSAGAAVETLIFFLSSANRVAIKYHQDYKKSISATLYI